MASLQPRTASASWRNPALRFSGPLGQKRLTRVIRTDVSIAAQPRPLPASLFIPEGGKQLPLVVFAATGHADYSIKDDWRQLNDDLARLGYASLSVAFNRFTPQEFDAVFTYAAGLDGVDHSRMATVGAMKASRPVVLAAIGSPDVRTVVLVSSARVPEISELGRRSVLFICGDKEANVPALSAARGYGGRAHRPARNSRACLHGERRCPSGHELEWPATRPCGMAGKVLEGLNGAPFLTDQMTVPA